MLSHDEKVFFSILDSWMKAGLPSPVTHTPLKDILLPIVGSEYWRLLKSMSLKGFVDTDDMGTKYEITKAGYKLHRSLWWRNLIGRLDSGLKFVVAIVAILGTVATILLSTLQLRQQSEQRSLREDLKQLTTQRDSIKQVLEDLQLKQHTAQPAQPPTDTKKDSIQKP